MINFYFLNSNELSPNLYPDCQSDIDRGLESGDILKRNENFYFVEVHYYNEIVRKTIEYAASMKDPYKVANCNFSQIEIDDERWDKYQKQRIERGFDDSELWNFDVNLALYILPRLKRFKEITKGTPASFTSEEQWIETLNEMIEAFELIVKGFDGKEEMDKVSKGLELFKENYFNLWY